MGPIIVIQAQRLRRLSTYKVVNPGLETCSLSPEHKFLTATLPSVSYISAFAIWFITQGMHVQIF